MHLKTSTLLRLITPTAAAPALVLAAALPARADDSHWTAGDSGYWSDAANWSPLGVPASDDVVWIGDLPHVHDHTVFLDMNATVAGLHLSDEMGLQTGGFDMEVLGTTTLFGDSTRLVVQEGGAIDFYTRDMVLGGTSRVIQFGGRTHINGVLTIGAAAEIIALEGESTVWFPSGDDTALVNNGRIAVGNAGVRFFPLSNDTRFDLDGVTENGRLIASATEVARLEFTGLGLADPFSGDILLNNARLQMHFYDPWEADAACLIEVRHSHPIPDPNRIEGQPFTFGGQIDINNDWGWPAGLRIEAETTLTDAARVIVEDTSTLEFAAPATVLGGTYDVAAGAQLAFSDAAIMRGGVFTTADASLVSLAGGSEIEFNGATAWEGEVTFNGAAVQNGDADVSATQGAVIHAERFDLDGTLGNATWNIYSNIVLNVDRIGPLDANRFTGTIHIGGGFAPRMTLNFSDPNRSWTMAGAMNLAGLTHLFETRLSGSPIMVEGGLSVSSGKVQIETDATFCGALVDIADTDAVLRMRGQTMVGADVLFMGDGTLQNGQDAEMTLMHGAALDRTGLVNEGVLELGPLAGEASAARFENAASGTLIISLGGYQPGDEHDVLRVTDDRAVLDGTLHVKLIDLGGGMFEPTPGDEFTIISAANGIDGAFADAEITSASNGRIYKWQVHNRGDSVVLRLASVSLAG